MKYYLVKYKKHFWNSNLLKIKYLTRDYSRALQLHTFFPPTGKECFIKTIKAFQ